MAARQRRKQRRGFSPTSYYKGTVRAADNQGQRSRDSTEKVGLLQKKMGIVFTVSILLISIGALYFYGISSPVFVEVPNSSDELTENLKKTTSEYLRTGLNRFKFVLNEKDLTQALNTEFPQLNSIAVEAPIFSRGLTVKGELKVPLALLERGEDTFIIDQHGGVYTDESVETSRLPKIKDASVIATSDAEYELPRTTILFARDFNDIVLREKISDKPVSITIANQPRELIWHPHNEDYEVKLLANRDPLDQALEYKKLRDYLIKNNFSPREYVDLRVDDTAYYR